ncbi:unnamed protein product [Spirodela intermedia]|uniref:histidine kinase n=1 Tax=Spirodela intermedia TaxID=51605 RepID=A0A7I8JKK8_SPIIN|nr:unnamed protein product [Spirodela intermedia]CAA6669982.1 unnamed protein product [Spirodela intermedia]
MEAQNCRLNPAGWAAAIQRRRPAEARRPEVGSLGFVLYVWHSTLNQVGQLVMEASDDVHKAALRTARDRTLSLFHHMNASSSSLAKVFSNNSFSAPDQQVSRALFLTYMAFYPIVTQVSFFREDGLLFSYFGQGNGTTSAIFSNGSASHSGSSVPSCYYSQVVDHDTGTHVGNPVAASVVPSTTTWLNDAFSHTFSFISLGSKWNEAKDRLILVTAPVKVRGLEKTLSAILSLGISVQGLVDMIDILGAHGGSFFLVTDDGQVLQKGGIIPNGLLSLDNGTLSIHIESPKMGNFAKESAVSCNAGNGFVDVTILDIGGQSFKFYCASLHVGINVSCPQFGTISYFLLLSVLFMAVVTCVLVFQWIIKYQRRDTFLHSSLIKQKEATQQAERKSMNKSLAFASASHDVRTSLAGIIGLIELCQAEVSPHSELDKNLDQMNVCASKLYGILNSVLDMSKVEAGKMQLEEAEFDIAKVIEESVDIFHIVALKKGLEVIWDPCDGSVLSSSRVKGDSGRLKQILDNLLSNAVKFTLEGHVLVRAWARRLNLEALTNPHAYDCNFSTVPSLLSCFSVKNQDVFGHCSSIYSADFDPNAIEFVFEVDDTGVGIPRDKRESIFENFVQVKESMNGQGGTGLGLGIVQSYVRLMGGEINIIDKGLDEKGTCFRFNVFLKSTAAAAAEGGVEFLSPEDQVPADLPSSSASASAFQRRHHHRVVQSGSRAMRGLKHEATHGVLLIQGEETRKILARWLEGLGVRVWVVDHWELLTPTLEKIKQKPSLSHLSIFERSHAAVAPGIDQIPPAAIHDPHTKMTSFSGTSAARILIIVDMGFEFYRNSHLSLNSLLKSINHNECRVVWLANSNTPTAEIAILKNKEVPCDLLLHKPLHGSRLQAILDLLQGFGEPMDPILPEVGRGKGDPDLPFHRDDKPLSGLRVLIAEDNPVLRRLTSATLSRLGATAESCENGREAVELVRRTMRGEWFREDGGVEKQRQQSGWFLRRPPFDIIFMDCEMPIMDGYQATKQIRDEEKQHGFHIPIVALTAHALGEEGVDFRQAGMDFHLMKPLQPALLMDAHFLSLFSSQIFCFFLKGSCMR